MQDTTTFSSSPERLPLNHNPCSLNILDSLLCYLAGSRSGKATIWKIYYQQWSPTTFNGIVAYRWICQTYRIIICDGLRYCSWSNSQPKSIRQRLKRPHDCRNANEDMGHAAWNNDHAQGDCTIRRMEHTWRSRIDHRSHGNAVHYGVGCSRLSQTQIWPSGKKTDVGSGLC